MKVNIQLDLDNQADNLTYEYIQAKNSMFSYLNDIYMALMEVEELNKDIKLLEKVCNKLIQWQCDYNINSMLQNWNSLAEQKYKKVEA